MLLWVFVQPKHWTNSARNCINLHTASECLTLKTAIVSHLAWFSIIRLTCTTSICLFISWNPVSIDISLPFAENFHWASRAMCLLWHDRKCQRKSSWAYNSNDTDFTGWKAKKIKNYLHLLAFIRCTYVCVCIVTVVVHEHWVRIGIDVYVCVA